ncbi:MAG: tRNA (adenosine(37)-N6)-threonylcarbamoyltransferase complex dimerization subunit type 1 TsaB [Candidatus Omnitrophota bacterium]|nr:tRNA (adenosine(37)-N6)-threonylcarbamoyltransferase complex dimerization subunit type 1 TsaB [Candidatus Omnitrophota bacterium]
MNLLAIDTTTDNVSLSIMKEDKIIVDFNRRIRFGASKVMPLIEKLIKKASLDLKKIDAFVIGAGPGSFTGLRISFSIVKGFGLALNKPIIKIGSFYSLAYPFIGGKHRNIAVVSDARRQLIYTASFKINKNSFKMEGKEKLIKLEDFVKGKKDCLFITHDKELRTKVLSLYPDISFYNKDVWPKSAYLLELAKSYYIKEKFTSVNKLEPLYLHPKTCQIRMNSV